MASWPKLDMLTYQLYCISVILRGMQCSKRVQNKQSLHALINLHLLKDTSRRFISASISLSRDKIM